MKDRTNGRRLLTQLLKVKYTSRLGPSQTWAKEGRYALSKIWVRIAGGCGAEGSFKICDGVPWEGAVMNWWSCRPVELAEIFLRGNRGNREKIMNGWAAAGNSHDLNDSGPAHASWTTRLPSITFAGERALEQHSEGRRGPRWCSSPFRASRHEKAQDPSA